MQHRTSILPGRALTLGYTLTWMSLIVLIPLAGMLIYASRIEPDQLWKLLTNRQLLAALRLSLYTALGAALVVSILGAVLAWVLSRYQFPGRRLIDAMIDLPFALPTSVAGMVLAKMYAADGAIGSLLPFPVSNAPLGIVVALVFVTLPFAVRTLQPVIKDIPREVEEVAHSLGAGPTQTFIYVLLPALFPAWLTGFSLALARGIGEYGSVVFISGNIAFHTEILPLVIASKLDNFDYVGATVIGTLILLISFIMLLVINLIQRYVQPASVLWLFSRLRLPKRSMEGRA